jgi:phenylglyoxylate dehydrogenase beta subunit
VGERGHGKTQDAKNLPLLMVMHNCSYVATASTAFMEDLYDKLDRAIVAAKTGFAYLHIYSPCTTGWRFPSDQNVEVARKAVESNFVLLWEFNPRDGLQFTHPVENARPIDEYLETLGKYRHLDPDQVAHIERTLANNLARIRGFVAAKGTADAEAGRA